MSPNLFWISGPWRGRLAVMTRPRGGDWLEDEAAGWRLAGLDTVVSLLEEDEAAQLGLGDEGVAARSQGIEFLSLPIPDRGVPPSTPDALMLLKNIAADLESGRNVGLHCRQSIGRSGLIAAGVLMTGGLPVEEALEKVGAARGATVPETPEQLSWIQRLPTERLPVAP